MAAPKKAEVKPVAKEEPKAGLVPSPEAFYTAVYLKSDFDLPNYGRIQPNTYKVAFELAKELEARYHELASAARE